MPQSNTKETIRIYLRHADRYRWYGVGLLLFQCGNSLLNGITPLYYKKFFDTLIAGNFGLPIYILLFTIGGLQLGKNLSRRVAEYADARLSTPAMADLANTCYEHLQRHSYSFFTNHFVGSMVKRVNAYVRAFDVIKDRVVWDLFSLLVNIGVILFVLFRRAPIFSWVILAWVGIFLVINIFLTRVKFRYDVERSEADTKATAVLADTLTNNLNVKLFVGYAREKERYNTEVQHVRSLRLRSWFFGIKTDLIQGFLVASLQVAIFYYVILFWQRGILTPGDFVLIQVYLLSIFDRVWDFGRVIRQIYENFSDAEEMTEMLLEPHEVVDIPRAKNLVVREGEITFRQVEFNYHETRTIMKDFSLHVRGGEKLAFVGPSGAGKSTIVKLLLRLYDVSGGEILIDGQNIANVTQESLWKHVSLVPQEPILFHRPLLENIRYGKPNATKKEVLEASKRAHCHEFISEFPEGYETLVGERGVKLSGGERQRVAIARAILRDAPILLLDEATSQLDSESESYIQDALKNLMKGKTVIVIAHRLSTIMHMDRIIVMDHGRIVDEGTHSSLILKSQGLYATLWGLQAGGFLAI